MKILQISGSGRNSGKTTLGCALIQAFPTLRWSVLKLTPHEHPANPSLAAAMPSRNALRNSLSDLRSKDTDRYLAAGAIRAERIQIKPAQIKPAQIAQAQIVPEPALPAPLRLAAIVPQPLAAITDVLLIESGQPLDSTPWPLLPLAIASLADSAHWKPEFLARLAASQLPSPASQPPSPASQPPSAVSPPRAASGNPPESGQLPKIAALILHSPESPRPEAMPTEAMPTETTVKETIVTETIAHTLPTGLRCFRLPTAAQPTPELLSFLHEFLSGNF